MKVYVLCPRSNRFEIIHIGHLGRRSGKGLISGDGRPLRIGTVPESSLPTCTLVTRLEGYASIHHTMASLSPKDLILAKKSLVDMVKGHGKIKVYIINCTAFVHHTCNSLLRDWADGVGSHTGKVKLRVFKIPSTFLQAI